MAPTPPTEKGGGAAGPPGAASAPGSAPAPPPGEGGRAPFLLLLLRGVVLLGALLLLLNPSVPGEDPARTRGGIPDHWVVVELHPALAALDSAGQAPLLEEAVVRARGALTPGSGLLLVGSAEESGRAEPSALSSLTPASLSAPPGALAERLDELALAGARSISLVSPFRGPPLPAPVGVGLRRIPVGDRIRNAGVVELELPRAAAPGERVEGVAVVVGEDRPARGPEDPDPPLVALHLRTGDGGGEGVVGTLPLPAPGTRVRVPFQAELPADGRIRLEAVLEGDQYPADNALEAVIPLEAAGGILLVSRLPDGEPRRLLPLLEASTGLPGEGWIQVGPDRFLALGEASAPVRTASLETLRGRAAEARLLVVQGPGLAEDGTHPGHRALLHLRGASPDAPLWRVDPELPASPLSGFLEGILPPGGGAVLPPIRGRPRPEGDAQAGGGTLQGEESARVALRLRGGAGGVLDAVTLVEGAEGRQVRVEGTGYWQWAAASDRGAAFYRALWGGAAAWLLAGPAEASRPGAAEVEGADAPGGPSALRLPGSTPYVERWVHTVALAAPGAPQGDPLHEGALEETHGGVEEAPSDPPRRGLRTHPLPWFLVLGALAGEWILRRRQGLA